MTLTEIENLQYIDCANILYKRLFNIDDDEIYVWVVDTDLPDYDRMLVKDGYVKPTEEQLLAELEEYKAELTEEENARLEAEAAAEAQAEVERQAAEQAAAEAQARQDRVSAITEYFAHDNKACTTHNNGEWVSNAKWYANIVLKELLPSDFTVEFTEEQDSLLSELESIIANRETEKQEQANDLQLTESAKKTISKCNRVFEYVVKYNQTKYIAGEIDDTGLDTLETQWADIVSALHNFRPKKAAGLITALDLTGTIYTETQRTDILNILGE